MLGVFNNCCDANAKLIPAEFGVIDILREQISDDTVPIYGDVKVIACFTDEFDKGINGFNAIVGIHGVFAVHSNNYVAGEDTRFFGCAALNHINDIGYVVTGTGIDGIDGHGNREHENERDKESKQNIHEGTGENYQKTLPYRLSVETFRVGLRILVFTVKLT